MKMSQTCKVAEALDCHFHCILVSTLVAKTVSCSSVEFYIMSRPI